ncbi:MAG: hypothetical protein ACK43K_14705 [Chitinophagales bacterium]|jgi:hypothetical protein|nr:hypothetical protein [Sphingobacteriales bacterium]
MPINNLGKKHITATQITDFDKALADLLAIATNITTNLTDEERSRFGSINEKNKLFVNGVLDYATTQPDLKSPDVDWTEFQADYDDRKFADTRADKIENLLRMITDFKIVHDYDNYQDSLTDYDYTKYKASTSASGYTEKQAYLRQFFPNTGGSNTPPSV